MIKLFALLPFLLSLIWWLYLKNNGWSIKEGKKGFIYILVLSGVIASFFTLMLYLTN